MWLCRCVAAFASSAAEGRGHRDSIANLDDNQIVADLNATAEMLQMMNNVDPNRMAIAGHCMGGRVSFLGVSELERSNVTLPITVAICSRLWAPVMQVLRKVGKIAWPSTRFFRR